MRISDWSSDVCSSDLPITAWALEQACQDAMEWDENVRVAVNISPVLIKSDGLPRAVIAALMRSGLKARRLELEVTESIFLEDSGRSEEHTSELQSLMRISYAVFCLKKKKQYKQNRIQTDKL